LNKIRVSLTGGLGNQLFQLACALSNGNQIELITGLGNPRVSKIGHVDIGGFALPSSVIFEDHIKYTWLSKKAVGYLLRAGLEPKFVEKIWGFSLIAKTLGSIILTLDSKRRTIICNSKDVGFSKLNTAGSSTLLVGYFQTCKWAEKLATLQILKNIHLKNLNEVVELYKIKAKVDLPLIVHIRLGDYRYEPKFGALENKYYEKALKIEMAKGVYKRIWIFSNEPKEALNYIPAEYINLCDLIDYPDLSSAEVMEIMRLGYGYIIANSTFSWWGAFLTYNDNAPVIAQEPWFKSLKSPNEILPKNWLTLAPWSN